MTTLKLVAHAITPGLRGLVLGGGPDPDPAGLEAARQLKVDADAAYCGPEPAAIRTADALGLSAIVDPALRDRSYGDWTGRNLEDLLSADPVRAAAWLDRPHTAPPAGDTENDVITRAADWLGDLAERHDERSTVAAVVHPAVVRAMVLYALEAPAESLRHVDVRPLAVVTLTGHMSGHISGHMSGHAGHWSLAFG